MAGRDIGVRISAVDDFTATLNRFKSSMGDAEGAMSTAAGKITSSLNGLKTAWLQMAGVVASAAWMTAAAREAYNAELATNKLRIQVEALGLSYGTVKNHLEDTISATSRYALVQDDDVRSVLQQLLFYTGDYQTSLENLNLTYDLAYQKGVSSSQAAELVGKAITGNTEALSRYFPELKNVDELLGKYATSAEKAAYAQIFFTERVNAASSQMTEHERTVLRVKQTYDDLKQSIGFVLLEMADETIETLKSPIMLFGWLGDRIDRATNLLNPYNVTAAEAAATNQDLATSTERAAIHHQKYLEGVSAGIKILSDAREREEAQKKTAITFAESLVRQTEELQKQINKLNMEEASYYEWERGLLILRGASITQVNEYITALRELNRLRSEAKPEDFSKTALGVPDYSASSRAYEERAAASEAARQTAAEKLFNMKSPYGGFTNTDQFSAAYNEYDNKLIELERYNATKLELMQKAGASELEIEAAHAAMSNQYAAARRDFQINTASQTFGAMSNLMQNLYVLAGSKNKALFDMMKAFAITEAVINTATAITAALKNPPGPPISFAYAAAAAAAGAAQIMTISNSEPGSKQTISAPGNATPAYGGGSPTAYPIPQRFEREEEVKTTKHITVNIYNPISGKDVKEAIVDILNDAAGMNYKIDAKIIQ